MRSTILAAAFALGALLAGNASLGAFEFCWDYQPGHFPVNNGGTGMSRSDQRTPDEEPAIEVTQAYARERLKWPSHIQYRVRVAELAGAKAVRLRFYVKGAAGDEIELRATEFLPDSGHFSPTVTRTLTGEWQLVELELPFTRPPAGRFMAAPRILFTQHGENARFLIGAMTVRAVTGKE